MSTYLTRENEVHASFNPCSQAVDLYLFEFGYEHERKQVQLVGTAVPVPEYARCEPSISLNTITAQRLMDQLWNCGFRPTEGSGSAGALAATQKHLEDMRTVAFSQLGIPNENGPQVSKNAR